MTAPPRDPFPPRFTLGRVLALAWRGYRQRWIVITLICLIAGAAGALLPRLFPISDYFSSTSWPLVLSLIETMAPALFLTPALIILLQVDDGNLAMPRSLIGLTFRKALVVAIVQGIVQVAGLIPAALYYLFDWDSALTGIFMAANYLSQVAVAALDCVLLPALVIERSGPLDALRRSIELASGHWLQLLILGLIIYLSGIAIGLTGAFAGTPILHSLAGHAYDPFDQETLIIILTAELALGMGLMLIVSVSIFTAAYRLLAAIKDGRPTHEMAQVFD